MDFDWIDAPFDLKKISPREIEESYEDPFSLRLLPEQELSGGNSRFFKSRQNRRYRLQRLLDRRQKIPRHLRQGNDRDELSFYERRNAEFL